MPTDPHQILDTTNEEMRTNEKNNNSVLNSTITIPQFLFYISLLRNLGFAGATHTSRTLSSRCEKNFTHVTSVSPTPVDITPGFRRQSVHEQSFIQPELHDTYIHLFCPPPPPKLLLSDFPKLTLAPFLSFGLILLSGRNANTHSSQASMCIINPLYPPPNSPLCLPGKLIVDMYYRNHYFFGRTKNVLADECHGAFYGVNKWWIILFAILNHF